MELIKLENRTPYCYESGEWDGQRSDFLLVKDRNEDYHVVRMYHGFMDGSEFGNFYDRNDYEVENVEYWIELD